MDEVIEKIVAEAKKQVAEYGYGDQWVMLGEAARRLEDLGCDALKLEYLTEELEGGDG